MADGIANRESQTSWKDMLLELKSRGLREGETVVSDDHPGLKRAIAEVLPEAVWSGMAVAVDSKLLQIEKLEILGFVLSLNRLTATPKSLF